MALVLAVSASAQGGRDIYNKYSDKAGVSAIYISPSMFSLIKSLPDVEIEDKDIDFSNVIRTFEGMYILDVENAGLAAQINAEVEDFVKKGRYELLMETKDDGEKMRIYIATDKDRKTVTDFVMLAVEEDEVSVISITGKMPFEELQKLLAA